MIRCDEPVDVAGAVKKVIGYNLGDKVIYNCAEGGGRFYTGLSQSIGICSANGQWAPSSPGDCQPGKKTYLSVQNSATIAIC